MGHGDAPPVGPRRQVSLRPFYIDLWETTVAAYEECVRAGTCEKHPEAENPNFSGPDMPVTLVSWHDAKTYCKFVGKRLPTEAQWERAARGMRGRTYPWGTDSPFGRANFVSTSVREGARFVTPVGRYIRGASEEGVYDLAGNVAEWTADVYREDYHLSTSSTDPRVGKGGIRRTVRGGDFRTDAAGLAAYERDGNRTEDSRGYRVGFRCVRDAPSKGKAGDGEMGE